MRAPFRPFSLAAAVALGVACSRPETAAPRPAPAAIDACSLLTLEEAKAVDREIEIRQVRSAVDIGKGPGDVKCTYGILEPVPRLIGIEVRRFPSVEWAQSAQREAATVAARLATRAITLLPGVGDEAFWAGGNVQQLHARRGDLRLVVTVELGPHRRGAAVAIAQRALRRLAGIPFTAAPATTAAP
jgi:hypothetical protein